MPRKHRTQHNANGVNAGINDAPAAPLNKRLMPLVARGIEDAKEHRRPERPPCAEGTVQEKSENEVLCHVRAFAQQQVECCREISLEVRHAGQRKDHPGPDEGGEDEDAEGENSEDDDSFDDDCMVDPDDVDQIASDSLRLMRRKRISQGLLSQLGSGEGRQGFDREALR